MKKKYVIKNIGDGECECDDGHSSREYREKENIRSRDETSRRRIW